MVYENSRIDQMKKRIKRWRTWEQDWFWFLFLFVWGYFFLFYLFILSTIHVSSFHNKMSVKGYSSASSVQLFMKCTCVLMFCMPSAERDHLWLFCYSLLLCRGVTILMKVRNELSISTYNIQSRFSWLLLKERECSQCTSGVRTVYACIWASECQCRSSGDFFFSLSAPAYLCASEGKKKQKKNSVA